MVNTRFQTSKIVSKDNPPETSNRCNTSYISIVSTDRDEKNEENDILTELRNKLAVAGYQIKELEDVVEKKEIKIQYLSNKCEKQQLVIENLHKTIKELTETTKSSNGVSAETQTDSCEFSPNSTQTVAVPDILMDKKPADGYVGGCLSNKSISSKPKILLLGDSHARTGGEILNNNFPNFETLSVVKPNAKIEAVLNNAIQLTKDFSKEDYIIIIGGTNNALTGAHLNRDFLEKVCNCFNKTNVILCAVPFWLNRPILNEFINSVNMEMYNIFSKVDRFHYADSNVFLSHNDYTRHGLHLNIKGKNKLFSWIKFYIVRGLATNSFCQFHQSGNIIEIVPSVSSNQPGGIDQCFVSLDVSFDDEQAAGLEGGGVSTNGLGVWTKIGKVQSQDLKEGTPTY